MGGCNLEFGRKISIDCQKCVLICPEKNLQEKNFLEKNKEFDKISDNERSFFWIFHWEKWISGRELSAQLSRLECKPAGNFGGKYVSRKKSVGKKAFILWAEFCSLLSNLFVMSIINASLFTDERFETNHFFEQKVFSNFFKNLRRKMTYSGNESSTDCQKWVSSN